MLEDLRLPDAAFAPIVHDLSHTETDGERRFVNYRDMSVQQLGSIYERLLEREPVLGDGGKIVIRPQSLRAQGQRQLLLDFLCGLRWHTVGMKRLDRMAREGLVSEALGRQPEVAYKLLSRGPAGPKNRSGFWTRPS